MTYRIIVRRAAQKQLDRLASRDYKIVAEAISSLEQEPRQPRVKKLSESGLWRIRVGRCRVVYSIDDRKSLVIVVRVARRAEDTYKRL